MQFFRKQIHQNLHGCYPMPTRTQNNLDEMHFLLIPSYVPGTLCTNVSRTQCFQRLFPARKLIVTHERGKKNHPSKQRKLPAGFIQIRAGTSSTGFWLFCEHPVKLASDASELIANISCTPTLSLVGLAAPK